MDKISIYNCDFDSENTLKKNTINYIINVFTVKQVFDSDSNSLRLMDSQYTSRS